MEREKNVGGRDRLVRTLLAVVLTVVAVSSLRSGRRKTGLLAGIGALGFGFNAVTCFCGVNETLGIDTTSDTESTTGIASEPQDESTTDSASRKSHPSRSLTCASCGQPILVGQGRGPNDQDEIVHDTCP